MFSIHLPPLPRLRIRRDIPPGPLIRLHGLDRDNFTFFTCLLHTVSLSYILYQKNVPPKSMTKNKKDNQQCMLTYIGVLYMDISLELPTDTQTGYILHSCYCVTHTGTNSVHSPNRLGPSPLRPFV
jgi:hypothetical protein